MSGGSWHGVHCIDVGKRQLVMFACQVAHGMAYIAEMEVMFACQVARGMA